MHSAHLLARRRTTGARAAIALAALALAAVVIVASRAGTALVMARPVAEPDLIVSLASHEWERLPEAARLAGRHPDATLVLTLPRPATDLNCHDCAGRVARLTHLGVPRERIVILPLRQSNTHGEAEACLSFARDHGLRRIEVVTSPYHTRRALATFRHVFEASGIEVGVQPATATSPADPRRWWWTPYDRWYVRYEWAALAYYAVRYGISPFA